jgi:ribonuclease P protein component
MGQGGIVQTQKKGQAQTDSMSCSDGSFAKKERLIKTADFGKVYRSGSSSPAGPFVLKVAPNNIGHNRIGFSISARSIKSAVRRNRIRRLFRESFRKNKAAVRKSFDMVLVVRKDTAKGFSYSQAEDIFLQLVRKAGIAA